MSRKEDRLSNTVNLIRQAIHSCGDDFATINIRAKLVSALQECGHIEKKRGRRETIYKRALAEAANKAQKNYEQWWKQIEENVRKATENKQPKDENGQISGI